MLQKLLPTRIGSDGRIMEWMEEYEECEPGHRHISHLYGLHPSEQITVDNTPKLAEAARKTLETRLKMVVGIQDGVGHGLLIIMQNCGMEKLHTIILNRCLQALFIRIFLTDIHHSRLMVISELQQLLLKC